MGVNGSGWVCTGAMGYGEGMLPQCAALGGELRVRRGTGVSASACVYMFLFLCIRTVVVMSLGVSWV